MWGWIYLGFAAVQLVTGGLIVSMRGGRRAVGAALGIGIALLPALMVLMSIGAYPIWSIILLAIDGLIIYGLAAYGFEDAEA